MKMPKMPKIPMWGWAVLVLAVVYYVFLREGMAMPKNPEPTVVDTDAKKKTD
jgi:hypothetical protein